jgi:hypothetical protein
MGGKTVPSLLVTTNTTSSPKRNASHLRRRHPSHTRKCRICPGVLAPLGFHGAVVGICPSALEYPTLPMLRGQAVFLDFLLGFSETSAKIYQPMLRKNPVQHRPQLQDGRSLKTSA